MRVPACAACLVLIGLISSAPAQQSSFPYDAKVVAAETWVRAGGGTKFYATQRLTAGAIVRVLRHDPGGWYVIEPPEGSFSWIPERYVNQLTATEGEVREDHVIAFVGSELADESSVFQRRMKSGEKVTILGSKTLDTTSGPQAMLKIRPPARERRWIPGAAVAAVDPARREESEKNPFEFPPNSQRPDVIAAPPIDHGGGLTTDIPQLDPSDQLQRLQLEKAQRQRLAEIDQRFRDMVLRDVSYWDLDSIERDYRSLQDQMSNRQTAGAVDLRYPAIERYRQRMAQLRDVRQLQSQTEARDAELVARHSGSWLMMPGAVRSASPVFAGQGSGTPLDSTAVAFENYLQQQGQQGGMQAAGEGLRNPEADSFFPPAADETITRLTADRDESASGDPGAIRATAAVTSAGGPKVIRPGSPENRFVGAGIVQRSPGPAPAWVLMAPSGRVLADLKTNGRLQLEQFVGRQVGVQGSRWSQKDRRDIIDVTAVEPVRLQD
ncbi:MAG: hypothetical protein ACKO2P_20710 [Planctomycetota bacterium]